MAPQSLTTRDWIDYCKALLTPAIAVLGIFIAWLQWRTNHNRLKLERFDYRFRRFEATREFLQAVILNPAVDESDRLKFLSETTGSRFIFNKEISDYLTQIHDRAVDLQTLNEEVRSNATKAKELGELKKWFNAQLKTIEDRFASFF